MKKLNDFLIQNKENTILFLSVCSILILSLLFFFIIPNSKTLFSFSGNTFFQGEIWRILTFSFVHFSQSHLFENVVALFLVALIAYELGLKGWLFFSIFLGSAVLIAFADLFIFPFLVIAGASLGLYAVLGSLSLKGSQFFPKSSFLLIFLFTLIMGYFIQSSSCSDCSNRNIFIQSVFHLLGLGVGVVSFSVIKKYEKRQKKLLRVIDNDI